MSRPLDALLGPNKLESENVGNETVSLAEYVVQYRRIDLSVMNNVVAHFVNLGEKIGRRK